MNIVKKRYAHIRMHPPGAAFQKAILPSPGTVRERWQLSWVCLENFLVFPALFTCRVVMADYTPSL
jgi:hypothetical protein